MTITPLVSDSQWSASDIQMINWGGFEGYHRISFALGCTLVTGASGSGKSTLLDAVIAVLMDHTVPFNGASNESVGGPPRGGQQRSILTYLRGKKDATAGGADGKLTDMVLRGDGEATWGAIALSFVNSDNRRFTVLRTYFAPATATGKGDITERRFTMNGEFDLRDISDLRRGAFQPEAMKSRFPGIKPHSSDTEFRQSFCTRLGIGQAGKEFKALRLLARIQAARPLATVDELYKRMVIEDPETLGKADECLAHFASLDQSFRDLETTGKKERQLRGIDTEYARWQALSANADQIDRFQVTRTTGTTPFRVWQLRHRRRLLDAGEELVRNQLADAQGEFEEARALVATLEQQIDEVKQQERDNGGGAVDSIEAKIRVAQTSLDQAHIRLEQLVADTEDLGVAFATEDVFTAAVAAARAFATGYQAERQRLMDERDLLKSEKQPEVLKQIANLEEELRSLRKRDGLVPREYHDARVDIAEACGLKVADLPFAAELMDIADGSEQWRLAAEVTLNGVGLTLLMDVRREDHVRKSIDRLNLRRRINFDGVDLTARPEVKSNPGHISAKLKFKEESPFIGWVKERVTRRDTDHLCVDDAAWLGGGEPKVTINGQTSHGWRGAHGRNPDHKPILGFSNEARKQEIANELQVLYVERDRLRDGIRQLEGLLGRIDNLDRAHRKVLSQEWPLIDVSGLDRALRGLEKELRDLLEKSDILKVLAERRGVLTGELKAATKREVTADEEVGRLKREWAAIADHQDATMTELTPIEQDGAITVNPEQDQFLREKLAEQDPDVGWSGFDKAADRLRARLVDESRRDRDNAQAVRVSLEKVFATFSDQWPDPNRGTTIDSYRDYLDIYNEIVREGLTAMQGKFTRAVQAWSGQDLQRLSHAYDRAREDIDDRMDPVNRILRTVPFGPNEEMLQIDPRDIYNSTVDEFRKKLRSLSSNTTGPMTDDEAKARFLELREFMKELGWSETGAAKRNDALLDVRNHVKITAVRYGANGQEVGRYESLAGKSGGESQELAAFIVGAALRYQLGDGDRPEPRFAPVFLDEGFVKSDWEYAGRAVQAWRRLGFQLIVSAPLDKVTGLEPHMDTAAVITKELRSGYSFITEFPSMEAWEQHKALGAVS